MQCNHCTLYPCVPPHPLHHSHSVHRADHAPLRVPTTPSMLTIPTSSMVKLTLGDLPRSSPHAGAVNLLVDRREPVADPVRVRPVRGRVGVVVGGAAVAGAAALVDVRRLRLPRGEQLPVRRHRHVLGQLPAGQDEERLAADHDVGVVGVVVHLRGVLQLEVVRQLESPWTFALRLCIGAAASAGAGTAEPVTRNRLTWESGFLYKLNQRERFQ